jgi:hypothetical protein
LYDAKARPRFGDLARRYRGPFETRPVRARSLRRPKQDGQIRLAQAFLDLGNEILTKVDIDLAKPRLDLLSFEIGSERLNELFVFCAVGKKDFQPVCPLSAGTRLSLWIAMKGRLPCSHFQLFK